eukprot:CAMPEP_0172487512 /NCGR_PEP_ID=MMETSP1066-20121228/16654_1 /TAXON_ID=671091 /ORGANISM="Coscinodiscus wailesii, Strain CCMP2513" /LENGTH=67 /DNA_ID=CAMNT_0013254189 /DNA_START=104 /DNA_END=307 /DNA_ORIENTATION=-
MTEKALNWRNLRGISAFMFEVKHPGTRPFAIGFGCILLASTYAQFKYTDEMKANSEYWQAFHATEKK